jgi:hypothetical protein
MSSRLCPETSTKLYIYEFGFSTLKRISVSRTACAEGGCTPHRIRVWYKGQQLVSITKYNYILLLLVGTEALVFTECYCGSLGHGQELVIPRKIRDT